MSALGTVLLARAVRLEPNPDAVRRRALRRWIVRGVVAARCRTDGGDGGGLPPVFEMETLELARPSVSIDSHPFLAEHTTNAFSIVRHTRPGGPEAISHVALDREHAIDVAHGVPLSAKPIAYRSATVLGGDASRFRDVSVRRPSSLGHRRDELSSATEVNGSQV